MWNNKGPGASEPIPIDPARMDPWRRVPPKATTITREFDEALTFLNKRLTQGSNIEVEFGSTLKADGEKVSARELAVFCMQAIDSVGYLADAATILKHCRI